MARKNGSESDETLLVRYLSRPHHPELENLTYVEFGSKCRLEKYNPDQPMHPLHILEDEFPGRPRRIQMVHPRHGDVFYLRALLLHRSARDWTDMRTINGITYGTYQEAARAMGLFYNRDEGIMAFEELVNFGAPPSQLRWIFAVLAVEGSPALLIWESHEDALSADIRDRMLRVTAHPPAESVRNELLLALLGLLQGLGKTLPDVGLPEPAEPRGFNFQILDVWLI
jgi:hypothetical protein